MSKLQSLLDKNSEMMLRLEEINKNDEPTAEEREEFSQLLDAIDANDGKIEEQRRYEKKREETSRSFYVPTKPDLETPEKSPDNRWSSFGEFLQAVVRAEDPTNRQIDPRLERAPEMRAPTGMSEAIPSDGGFVVGKDEGAEIIKKAHEVALLASKCRKIPIGANSNGLKLIAIDESSRATGSRWGGVQVYRANEAATVDAKKLKFRKINIDLEKIMGLCYMTDELLNDSVAMESLVTQAFSEEIAFKLDDEIIRGTGAGECLGILNAGCTVSQAKETGQAAATVVFENISKMWSRCYARGRNTNSVWLMNQELEPQLDSMSLAVGTGGVPVYMQPGGVSQTPYGTLKGRPVIACEHCEALGTVGDLILANLSEYLLIDKAGVQSASSMHVRFIYEEMTFRFSYRVNGQPLWNTYLTPYKGSNTLSPFVTLATRS